MVLSKPPDGPVLGQFSLKNKTAAVTGGARGIGLEVVKAFAEAGANVAVLYNSSTTAHEIAETISKDTGVRVKAYQADVRNRHILAEVLDSVVTDFGNLDIVVANSGIASHISALDYTEEQYGEIMKVNLDGAFWTSQAAGKIFQKQGYGNLIFTTSVSAQLVNLPQRQAVYNASKAAVVHLAKCLAVEWIDFARVNCISPGFIETEMIAALPQEWRTKWDDMVPAKRFCDPYELKGAYVFLASNASSYMTGANLVIDGAYTLP